MYCSESYVNAVPGAAVQPSPVTQPCWVGWRLKGRERVGEGGGGADTHVSLQQTKPRDLRE